MKKLGLLKLKVIKLSNYKEEIIGLTILSTFF
jgi:hypothetical protein